MVLTQEELTLIACFLRSTDMSLSPEDALGDVEQIIMNLPDKYDNLYTSTLIKAACILLSSNKLSPQAAIAEARKIMALAGF